MAKQSRPKRSFGEIGLPVSQKYIYPTRRRKMILAGVASAAALVLLVLLDVNVGSAGFICSGPLSYGHAELQDDCSRCHDPFGSVSAENCSSCHERFDTEHGIYTLPAHFVYRSNDSSRATAEHAELVCADCHVEHLGREAELTEVSDERCLACHAFGKFPGNHPEFDAVLAHDDTSLNFPHILHVEAVRDELMEDDASLETACLHCHRPDRQGKGFEPLDFDVHCNSCHHLEPGTMTPYVQVRTAKRTGVETLNSLKSSAEGARWVGMSSGSDMFQAKGETLRKRQLVHEDPWILDNLERFRNRSMILDTLNRLLSAAKKAAPFEEQQPLYARAVRELEELARRSLQPREREWAQGRAQQLQRSLEQQASLSEPDLRQALALGSWPLMTMANSEAMGQVARKLTSPCQDCHKLDGMRIAPVEQDQHTLRRAEFDHRAHVLVLRCLDCHSAIPIREYFEGQENVDESLDKSGTQNIPGIASCKGCHAASGSSSCATCHYFHPDKNRASALFASRDLQP